MKRIARHERTDEHVEGVTFHRCLIDDAGCQGIIGETIGPARFASLANLLVSPCTTVKSAWCRASGASRPQKSATVGRTIRFHEGQPSVTCKTMKCRGCQFFGDESSTR